MRIALCRSQTVFSVGVRLVTSVDGYDLGHGFSHAAVVLRDNRVIDSRWAKHGVTPPRSLAQFLITYPDAVIVDVPLPKEDEAQSFVLAQVGKPYDKEALAAFLVPSWVDERRNWQSDEAWFCSELAGATLKVGGWNLDVEERFLSPNGLAHRLGVPRCNRAAMACPTA